MRRLIVGFGLVAACGGPARAPESNTATPSEPSVPDETPPPSGPPIRVDCGDFTTCAVSQGGSVRCWGRDKGGETGDGGGPDRARHVGVPNIGKATSVALASKFACALLENQKVQCWGSGRLANDVTKYEHAKPTEVRELDGVLELVASGAIACARTATTIKCWGADPSTIGTPPQGAFKEVAVGFTHGCALDNAGKVTCWGTGDWATNGAFGKPSISGATAIASGDRHACVISKDKKVLCWGQNDAGQLGTKPDADAHKKPVEAPGIKGATKLVAGESSTCAVLADGTAKCWGSNGEGELGLGKRSSDERPTQVSALTDIADICLATTHGCALSKKNQIMCWGGNAYGQLGDGSKERKLTPTSVTW